MKHVDDFYLFNLAEDYHELHDQKAAQPDILAKMHTQLNEFQASIANSQVSQAGSQSALSILGFDSFA